MNECQVPLVELLKSVPNDARFVLEEEFSSAYYPVGTLCHQAADRIAELEKDLKKYDQLAWDDLSNPKTIWCDCGDGITANSGAKCGVCASTPQTKPLSDEEIKTEMGRVSSSYPTVECLIEFARAILRKAQEK
jgi:hypothetical protein